MKTTWGRILALGTVALIFLGLAGLELVSQRSVVDEPSPRTSALGSAPPPAHRPDSLAMSGEGLTFQRCPTAGRGLVTWDGIEPAASGRTLRLPDYGVSAPTTEASCE